MVGFRFKFKIQKIHNLHMKNNMNQKLILNIKIDSESFVDEASHESALVLTLNILTVYTLALLVFL